MKIDFAKLIKIEKQGIAVDIDETLSWTIGYWVEQMQKKFGNPENLSIEEIIKKYRYTQNVPYWQSDEAQGWVKKEIHSNETQKNLPLIENANIYLNKINKIVPIVAYITVRPETVISGTKQWLNKYDFPQAPIIAKPVDMDYESGNKWKVEILEKLYPDILGVIDDNAKLLQYVDKNYKGIVFLYDHDHVDSKSNAIACKNWPDTYKEVKKYFKK